MARILVPLISVVMLAGTGSAADPDEEVFRIGGDVAPPTLVHRVDPVRPNGANAGRADGTVVMALVVSSKGIPHDIQIRESLEKDLDQSAIDAVQQWRFEPAKKKDKPVAVRVTVEIRFHDM